MKKFLCLCGILAMMLMMTATEVKATEYHSDVGKFLSEQTYNFTNSAEVINLAPATVETAEYQLVNYEQFAMTAETLTLETEPWKNLSNDYASYQTVAVEQDSYDMNAPPDGKWTKIYGNGTSAPTNF